MKVHKGTEGTNKGPSAQAEVSMTVGDGGTWGGEKTGRAHSRDAMQLQTTPVAVDSS